ncbi:flagellar filament capping protein FliD [Clostridium sp. YIM B02515]|uniref:Flagellar hook-associated protein 2 n=1 Tax=Clostridium rhizosphaerae TaxID=2803861 RepID=A0ABS1TFC6_9CLOT|nr:flagellar filament capping protein FliD [Clostridium rhizosphaerae]MBL4938005.1 flagellar filament capping protein FliD [Clostridium rhizosphaerae]
MSDVSGTPSGMTGAGGGNLLRITGMATGLDVDAMVKKMMAAEQTKMDKIKQDRQTVAWRQEAYQDIIKDLKDLQSSFLDSSSSDKNILSSSSFSPFDVNGVNGAIANISASAGAVPGNYTINVTGIAQGAGVINQLDSGISLSTKLTDKNPSLVGVLNLNLTVNGNALKIKIDNSSGSMTLNDLITTINNQGSGTVKASFNELSGKFTLQSVKTGQSAKMQISSDSTSDLTDFLKINPLDIGVDKIGSNANFTLQVPGDATVYPVNDKESNNFSLNGVNYSLQGPGSSTVSISQNSQKVFDKIKGFIDKYNAIVDKIQTKITEKKNYDYKPLTDTQKSQMKEADITAWESKAKAGILRNDENLQKILQDLKESFSTAVTNSGLSFGKYGSNSIGLNFSDEYSKPAHIDIIDEGKLKSAISLNSAQVQKMFTNVSSTTFDGSYDSSKTTYREDGIFTRVKKILESNVGLTNVISNKNILTKYANYQDDFSYFGGGGTNTLPDQLYQKDKLIKSMTDALAKKQESYYQKFSKLETAMNQLNSQQSWLTQQLGG